MQEIPSVSVIVPCRNEESYINGCLDSIINNDYPKDRLEILVVDGNSEDATKQTIERYMRAYPQIRLFMNPKRVLASAWNIGIKNAKGDVIMALNAHAVFNNNYIINCVRYLKDYNADYAGGIIITLPRGNSSIDKAIALVLSHPFGVGNSYFRIGLTEPRWVDTAAFGGYRREIFQRAGLFNEKLARSQDMEFHSRIKKIGAKILLVPEMVSHYYIRSNFKDFYRDSFVNGLWVFYPLEFVKSAVSLRHLVPSIFILSLLITGIFAIKFIFSRWLFFSIIIIYFVLNVYFSLRSSVKEKNLRYALFLPIIFTVLHIQYGLGTLYAAVKVLISKGFWQNQFSFRGR